jgi:hypothetical protein
MVATVIGKPVPQSILDEDNAPTDELLDFCRDTGASLDWIFLGVINNAVGHDGKEVGKKSPNTSSRYEYAFTQLANLTEALKIVAWDFCQEDAPSRPLRSIRDAVIGISNSMAAIVAEADKADGEAAS